MALAWSLRGPVTLLRETGADLRALRRHLDELPETPHPHGF
jgi:hypothetical protein